MKRRVFLCAAVGLVLAGCTSVSGPAGDSRTAAAFDEVAMGVILQRGSASITGQATVKERDGTVAPTAGAQVLLMPSTPYTKEVAEKMASGQAQVEANARLRPFTRSTRADAEGNFQFFGLAPGAYVVLIPFRLEVSTDEGPSQRGVGALWREARVKEGQQVRVPISRRADAKDVKRAP